MEVPPQHAPPTLLLQAPEVLLQGEQAAVTVTVTAAAADGALRAATLHARAVHAESQAQLGLLVAGAASTPPAGPSDEPAVGQQAPGSGSASDGSSSSSGLVHSLGDVAAGGQARVVLLLDARYRGTAQLALELRVGARSPPRALPAALCCCAAVALLRQP